MGSADLQLPTAPATEGCGDSAVAPVEQESGSPPAHGSAARSSSPSAAGPHPPVASVGGAPGRREGNPLVSSAASGAAAADAAAAGPGQTVMVSIAAPAGSIPSGPASTKLAEIHVSVAEVTPATRPSVPGTSAAASSGSADSSGSSVSTEATGNGMEHFDRLRRRLLLATLIATAMAVPSSWVLFDLPTAASLLVGALAGLLYLLLLARSVARLGGDRRSIGKIQLLVPVVLVLASARIPQLSLVPALIGFLLYKPALLIQAYLDR